MKTTNYINTFIQVAEDCPIKSSEIPPVGKNLTAANIQFDMISQNPYKYTSDDVIFAVFASKNNIDKKKYDNEREQFFSKGQPCMRCSPLTKRYGWGIHNNDLGKIALFPLESPEYKKFSTDKKLAHVKAMRSSKK
jgi:hypothetical protein